VVLLNIWATWCAPCEQEMPSLQRLQEELGPQGLRIAAVSIDQGSPESVRKWIDERRLTFPVLHDRSGRIQQIFQTTGVPESFVLDRDGTIVKKVIGAAEWDHPAQKALFRRLLGRG
jgi:thiol-disulfide isomerase/thioredoxin